MTEQEIYNDVVSIIKEYAPDLAEGKELNMDTKVNTETAIDSMGFVLIVAKIENKYQIKISDRQMNKFSTIGDLVRYIAKKSN